MAEEEVVAYPVQLSDHKRKLENVESEVLEQHNDSVDPSNEVSVDNGNEAPDYSQAKRTKLGAEDAGGLDVEKTPESGSATDVGKEDNGEEKPEESESKENIQATESDNKMDCVDDNSKPQDNQPASAEAAASQKVSVEESKEVEKEAADKNKETNDATALKEAEKESTEVNDGRTPDDNESKEADAGGSKETGDESKEVSGIGSHEETDRETKEVNGGSSHKEVEDAQSVTRQIDVPSSKVGTLIGKGGEMVRYLQLTSGAKIQIRRDAEADPNSTVRPVEIIGNAASIEKAEKLINQVIAETEAGGVPALFARGVPEQMEIKVPNDKVGVIIGRGGETIKSMQAKSRARIQLIPPNPEADGSKERTVRISGDKRQIDIATALIQDVMFQEGRPSHYSGDFNSFQPRGPVGPPQWGSRSPHGPHSMPYNYHHGGPYPPQGSHFRPPNSSGSHFRPPNSGGYPPQYMPPRGGYGSSWDQRPSYSGPYEYYGRQGDHNPGHAPSHAPPYSHAGAQHSFGQPNYDNPPMQQSYGGGYGTSQQGYPPASGQHQMQQPPRAYGVQGSAEHGYGAPRPAAPSGDLPYQGTAQAAGSYGTNNNMGTQQHYGYASSAPGQQNYPTYSSAAPSDGYNGTQAPQAYEQPGVQPASGVQQTSAGYVQVPPTSDYSSYPSAQPTYGNQSNGNYGYASSRYPSYGGGNTSAYAAPVGQTAYPQTTPTQAGYDQSTTQSAGYAAPPGTAQ